MDNQTLYDIAKKLKLGRVLTESTRIFGGFLHFSYKLETEKGQYMIKCFGKASELFIKSSLEKEKLEEMFKLNNIPAIYPLIFNGKGLQVVNGEAFYVFPFVSACSLQASEIGLDGLKKIAVITAQMHSIDSKVSANIVQKPLSIDWEKYLNYSNELGDELFCKLKKFTPILIELTNEYNKAIEYMPRVLALSHNDMDCTNVLWLNGEPLLIDLECIGYNSPYYEAYKYALVYAGYEEGNIDVEKVKTFMSTYFDNVSLNLDRNIDSKLLYYASGLNLEWLEFSLRRALKIVGSTTDEQKIGFEQTELCIKEISHFYQLKDELINIKF